MTFKVEQQFVLSRFLFNTKRRSHLNIMPSVSKVTVELTSFQRQVEYITNVFRNYFCNFFDPNFGNIIREPIYHVSHKNTKFKKKSFLKRFTMWHSEIHPKAISTQLICPKQLTHTSPSSRKHLISINSRWRFI